MEPQDITFRHQLPAQLRFSDVDQFGHVNNAVYFQLLDTSKTRYWLDVLGPDIFQHMAIVVADIHATFLAPVFYPDEIAIQTAVVALGNKSFTLLQRVFNTRTRDIKCECRSVMVAFDPNTNTSIPLPEEVKDKIRQYEGKM